MSNRKQLIFADAALDNQISQIKQLIKQSMCGVTVDSMKHYGINYKQNLGVSIIRLREIAATFTQNRDLAIRLWQLDLREAKILATLLFPVENLDQETACAWASGCDNQELKEQIIMNLFRKSEKAAELCHQWLDSENIHVSLIAWMLAGRVFAHIKTNTIDKILTKTAIENLHKNPLYTTAIATSLAFLCRINSETAEKIYQTVNDAAFLKCPEGIYIADSVRNELIFSGYLSENS
jgi:3-methyladenine DNA glycosylase AlkD